MESTFIENVLLISLSEKGYITKRNLLPCVKGQKEALDRQSDMMEIAEVISRHRTEIFF